MRSKSKVWPIVALLAACAPEASPTPPAEAAAVPNWASLETITSIDGGFLRMTHGAFLEAPGVVVAWAVDGPGLREYDAIQKFQTEFQPLDVATAGELDLVVAVRGKGSIEIELWRFDPLDAAGAAAPCFDAGTWRLPRRSRVDRVWHEAENGPRGAPRALVATRSQPQRLLAWFERSREIVSFDLTGGAERPVASPSSCAVLTRDHEELFAFDDERGHVYLLLGEVGSSAAATPVVLLDADRDGVPERVLTPRLEEWEREGWSRLSLHCLPQE
ncbi:MAG: hypothetical protein HZA52_12125 [Planctomycetes bacterium]|nr:hypothetical protein [Planctomycetota bacterium]